MEAGERQNGKKQPMFVDTSMLESDIQILESEIMTPSPMATPLHKTLNTNFQTPIGKPIDEEDNSTMNSVRTPADNLLDKFQSLNESWVDVKTRSASTKKRVVATPTIEDLLNSPIPKFASALDDLSRNDVHRDDDDDVSSIGASTVSSMSSQESVFDRLYRQGTNQQRQRRTQKPSDSFVSPRENISTNEFYTPYSATSSVSSSKSRISKNSTSKQQTKKIRNRVVPTSATNSSVGKNKNNRELKVSPASSQDSVFDRLYRNQKRTETLWQAPPAPHLKSRSADRKKSGRKSGSRRASKIPAQSTPQTASKPQHKKKRISDSPAGVPKNHASSDIGGKSSIEPLLKTASTASESVDLTVAASSTVEESTRDDRAEIRSSVAHTRDDESIASSEKENKSRPGLVALPREQPTALKNSNWSTTSIDEDLAELAAIQRDLDHQQQHLAPTPRKTNVPMEKMFEKASSIEPKQLYPSSSDQGSAALHSELDDIDDILKAPQVQRSRAPSVASTATHTQVDDDDTTSRASSGFFTLDNAGSSLTFQPLVSVSRGSIESKQASSKTASNERIRPEQAAVTIQSWWKSCLAQVSLANMVVEHRNLTFPSAHDTSPMVLLRIINSTRPNSLRTEQQNDVLVAQSDQIVLELRLAAPSVSVLRRRLSNTMLLRAVLASARLEFEGIVFVEACQAIQRWWRRTRTRETDEKHAWKPSSALKVTGEARAKELSFYLEDASGGMLDENLLETLSKDSTEQETCNRTSFEPQKTPKTPICTELSLLDEILDSDEEPLVSPAKSSISQNNEVDRGRILFQTPPSSGDLASNDDGYVEQSGNRYDDPLPVETPPRDYDPVPVETPVRTVIGEDYHSMRVSTPSRSRREEGDQGEDNDERHEAAGVIQRSFRMLTITSAIEHSTPTRDRVRQQLSSPKFPRWQEDDPWLFKEPSDGFQLWIGSTDLIERNAARLATHNIVRAYLNGLRKYRRTKKAALIQSTFRRYQCRREYQKKCWAIVAIQHGWEMFKYRRMLRSKATVIEAVCKMKMVKNKFQMMRFAAVLIQSKWRSYHATREYSKAQFLASWLQRTCVRARGQRRRFLALRSATISLQYSLRVYRTKKQYNLEMCKATKIQSTWRMSFAMRKRLLSIYYVCKIQALVRSHFDSRDYLELRSSCIAAQSCWRKYRAMKTYESQLFGAVKMQTLWRRFVAVRWYTHQYQSVVRLQSLGRMQQCLRLKRKNLKAAVVIQRETRRFLVERSYIMTWKAALLIQTQQRRHSAQNSWFKTQDAVVCIQSVARAYICKLSFRLKRDASVKIQSLGRSYNQRCQFMADRNDITTVQSVVRRKLAQNCWRESRVAIIRCQKTIRCHLSSLAFRRAKTACTEIQKVYRRFHAIQQREIAKGSIVRIQSFLRMIHTQKASNHALFSVRILQRVVRGYQQWSKFTMQRQSAVKIQSIARSASEHAKYSDKKKASIALQSIARRLAARNRLREAKSASAIIQKAVRKKLYRSRYLQAQMSVGLIQATVRGFSERLRYNMTRKDVLTIQRCWRGAIARFQASSHYRAALVIQRYWRGKACRDLSKQRRKRILSIQRFSRGFIARRKHEQLLHSRLLLAQSSWRAAVWRRRFVARKTSASKLQATVRGHLARKEAMSKRNSVVVIQTLVRQFQQYRVFQKLLMRRYAACTLLQAHWKMIDCKKSYDSKRHAAVLMQACIRKFVATERFERALMSVRLIQSYWRMTCCQEEYCRTRVLVVMIQSLSRGRIVRRTIANLSSMATRVQRHWRGHFGRLCYNELVEKRKSEIAAATLIIQSTWRMHVSREEFRKVKSAAIVVQREWRAFWARESFEFSRIGCIVIQTVARGMLVRMEMKMSHQSALRIQKRWRGYLGARRFQLLFEQDRLAKLQKMEMMRRTELMGLAICAYHGIGCISIVVQKDFARQQKDRKKRLCILIQSLARGMLVRRKLRNLPTSDFSSPSQGLREDSAATKIQSVYRNWVARKHHELQSVIVIQSYWRSRVAYQQLQMSIASCVVVQRIVRGLLTRVTVNRWHKSAICIQKIWRGFEGAHQAKMLRGSVKAATTVQSKWRVHKASRRYERILFGVIHFQKIFRVSLARTRYELARTASIMIQSQIRGALIRQEVKSWNESVVCLQKTWRRYIDAKKIKSLSHIELSRQSLAASKIQSIYRMSVARDNCRSGLRSALVIQKHWRSSQSRERFEVCRGSGVIIQSIARGFLVRDQIKIWKESVIMVQKYWRSALARERYELCRASCVIIQSIIRKSFVRKKLAAWNESAKCLQKTWRKRKSSNKVQSLMEDASRKQSPPQTPETRKTGHSRLPLSITNQTVENEDTNQHRPEGDSDLPSISAIDVVQDLLNRSATPIQKVWRGASLRGSLSNSRMHSTCAATLIQASFRGHRARQLHQTSLVVQPVSATLVQKVWRGASLRGSMETSRIRSTCAAILVQASFRGHRARQLYQTTLMMQSVSATLIQSNVRGMFTRNIIERRAFATSTIQRFWRNRWLRLALLQLAMDERMTKELESSYRTQGAIVLQSLARRRIAQKSFCAIRNNIIVIQSMARGHLLRMRLNNEIGAAVTIQKHMRGASSRSHIRTLHSVAKTIQAFIRMFLVSRQFWFLRLPQESRQMLNNAARKIQVAFFLFKMRLAVLSMQSSAIILKRCIRGQLVRSAAKFALVHVNSSFHSPVILSFARVVAGNDPNYASTYVAWKRAVTQAQITSTIVIQSAVRRFLVRGRISREFNVSFDSHMLLDQTLIEEEHASASVIQQAFKRWSTRREYSEILENRFQQRTQAAIQLQRMARGRKARILAKARRTNAEQMSRNAAALAFEAIQRSSKSASVIQQAFKRWSIRREYSEVLENRFQQRNQAVIQLQRIVRGRKARTLAKAHRTNAKQMSRNATALVLEAIQRSSKARVQQLLDSRSTTASLSPALKRFAERTKVAQAEADMLASNPLPMYAVKVLKQLEIPNNSSSSKMKKNIEIKPIRPKVNEPKRPSTPVRCNKTQTVKKAILRDGKKSVQLNLQPKTNAKVALDLRKFRPETMKKKMAPNAKTSMKPTLQLKTNSVPLFQSVQAPKKAAPKQAKKDSKVVAGVSAMDLLRFGRETIKKAPPPPKAKITLKPKSTTSTQIPQSPPRRQGNNNTALFGDPNNMPSPIKKQVDWDWADEW